MVELLICLNFKMLVVKLLRILNVTLPKVKNTDVLYTYFAWSRTCRFPDARHKRNCPKRELSHLSYTNKCFPRGTVFLENFPLRSLLNVLPQKWCSRPRNDNEWLSTEWSLNWVVIKLIWGNVHTKVTEFDVMKQRTLTDRSINHTFLIAFFERIEANNDDDMK
mgnify:CR=1 FL=1